MVLTKFKRNSKEKIKSTHNGRFRGKNKRANRTRNEFEYKDKIMYIFKNDFKVSRLLRLFLRNKKL